MLGCPARHRSGTTTVDKQLGRETALQVSWWVATRNWFAKAAG